MNPATPIIVLEGLIGLGVVVLLYVLHQREMRALRRAKESAEPPENPLVRTRDAAQAKLQEMNQEIAVRREALAAFEAQEAAKAQAQAEHAAANARNPNTQSPNATPPAPAQPVMASEEALADETGSAKEAPPADLLQAKTEESAEAPPR